MRTVAVANQKGGIGKTTTVHSLAKGFAERGLKILAVDLDPQGNLTSVCGAENYGVPCAYELIRRQAAAGEVIQHINGYDIIPSNIMLASAEQELTQTGKEHRLREALEEVSGEYDLALIDTPPSLGVLTVNAFTAAGEVIVPTTAGIFAAVGIRQLNDTVRNVRKYCNQAVRISEILLTRFNPRANISRQIKELTEDVGRYISVPVYKTYIRSAVAVEEAQARNMDIFSYADRSTVAQDYRAFIEEFLEGGTSDGRQDKI